MAASRAPVEQMHEVAHAFADLRGTAPPIGLFEELDRTVALLSVVEPGTAERLLAIRDTAPEGWSAASTDFAWHGDWTPWNMSRAAGRIQLWDWERFEVGVPFGLDAVHYFVNLRTLRGGFTPNLLRAGLAEGTGSLGLAGRTAEDLHVAYLVKLATRYAASLAEATGAVIRPKAQLVLDELECRLGLTRGRAGRR
jgi:hypothetical protein